MSGDSWNTGRNATRENFWIRNSIYSRHGTKKMCGRMPDKRIYRDMQYRCSKLKHVKCVHYAVDCSNGLTFPVKYMVGK